MFLEVIETVGYGEPGEVNTTHSVGTSLMKNILRLPQKGTLYKMKREEPMFKLFVHPDLMNPSG